MNTSTRTLLTILALSASSIDSTTPLHAAVTSTEEATPKLPEIWVKAGPQERLMALRAAEMDGDRLLSERVFGLMVDADTSVQDLVLGDDRIKGAVQATLLGATTQGEPKYLPDGRVEVVRAIKIREITETLNHTIKGKILENGSFATNSDQSNVDRDVQDKVIDVLGNGALPDSEGQQKIMAKRAAELDAYRLLAGRIMGVRIGGNTTVRDFALKSDRILSSLSQILKAATPTSIKYNKDDGSCSVTMEIKVSDIVRTTERMAGKDGSSKTTVDDTVETKVFSETGHGVMRPVAEGVTHPTVVASSTPSTVISGGSDPFFETKEVLRQVIQSVPVLR